MKSQLTLVFVITAINTNMTRLIFRRKHCFAWPNNFLNTSDRHRLHFQTEKYLRVSGSQLKHEQGAPHYKGANHMLGLQ